MSLFRKLLMMQQKEFSYKTIDLGLPSGILWADRNIGAATPEDSGLYFQWGDTQGYTAEQVGDGEGLKPFSWTDYKFSIDGSSSNFSKYNTTDNKKVLDLEDDAAHVIMGGNWRMPTFEEYKELYLNTDIYLVLTDGEEIQGTAQDQSGEIKINWASIQFANFESVKFYKKGDKQTYMFVPLSGSAINNSVQYVNNGGKLWSSSIYFAIHLARELSFGGLGASTANDMRCYGIPVRGVFKRV